ncbi:MAG: hypothetical protein QM778_28565 [Myxococcales bacterium]
MSSAEFRRKTAKSLAGVTLAFACLLLPGARAQAQNPSSMSVATAALKKMANINAPEQLGFSPTQWKNAEVAECSEYMLQSIRDLLGPTPVVGEPNLLVCTIVAPAEANGPRVWTLMRLTRGQTGQWFPTKVGNFASPRFARLNEMSKSLLASGATDVRIIQVAEWNTFVVTGKSNNKLKFYFPDADPSQPVDKVPGLDALGLINIVSRKMGDDPRVDSPVKKSLMDLRKEFALPPLPRERQ